MDIQRTEQKMQRRREFLRTCLLGGAVLGVRPTLLWSGASSPVNDAAMRAWEQLPEILARIKPPIFPDRDFDIHSSARPETAAPTAPVLFRNPSRLVPLREVAA